MTFVLIRVKVANFVRNLSHFLHTLRGFRRAV
jgi:hypothetical protein